MELIKMELNNFKKTKHFVLDTAGEDRWIFGKNATGKTTLADAFYWVLANKTSQDKKCDDDIKLKDADGNPQTDGGIEHSVELTLKLDNGDTKTFKKVYSEKWTKQAGSANKEFSGHTTNYFIDSVSKSQKDYNAFIEKNICDIDILKMVSLTSYFCSIHWKKQREALIDICGDVSDDDVINASEALKDLPKYLEGKPVNDFIAILKDRKRKINSTLDKMPARIDEATQGLPDTTDLVRETIETELADLKKQQNKARNEIASLNNGSTLVEKRKRLAEIDTAIEKIKQKYDFEGNKQAIEDERKIGELKNKQLSIKYDIDQNNTRISNFENDIAKIDTKLVKTRTDYKNIYSQAFDESQTICPTCGQTLPAEKIDAAKEKFNLDKSTRLEIIRTEGHKLSSQKSALEIKIKDLTDKITASNIMIEQLNKDIAIITERRNSPDETDTQNDESYLSDVEYQKLRNEKVALHNTLNELQSSNVAELQKQKSLIEQLDLDISERQRKLLIIEQHEAGQIRIKELRESQKNMGSEYDALAKQLTLAELFIKSKVKMLSDKINSKFEIARFKLFDQQVNGGIDECCEAITSDGSPYSKTMSNGEKVKIGLDICTTIAKHYNLNIPIFIDNAESVTDLQDTVAQQIRFIVSSAHDELLVKEPIINNKKQAVA